MKRAIFAMAVGLLSCSAAICSPQELPMPPDMSARAAAVRQQLPNIKGAPFTGEFLIESKGTLRDGTVIDLKRPMIQYRDSEGRTRREIEGNIVIFDPVAGVNYNLNPKTMTGTKGPRIMSTDFEALQQAQRLVDDQKRAAAAANGGPYVTFGTQATSESLGTKVMHGLTVEGTRTTMMVRFGGTEAEDAPIIKVVQERWYSPELQLDVMFTSDDPRQATITVTRYTKIQRGEPDPALFRPPSGYTVKDLNQKREELQ
jgi:hypothetical protein